ncbi:arsenate reductase ArsC [Persephonella sp.]
MIKIGFICTGNTARSQMAEGFCKFHSKILSLDIKVYSAGSKPAGEIHPLTYTVMKEKGIDISDQFSKSIDEIPLNELDYIITLCSEAVEDCPTFFGKHIEHWNLPDPVKSKDNYQINSFRNVRDIIELKIKDLLKRINS